MSSDSWAGSHGAASGNVVFAPETYAEKAILALIDGLDHDIFRSFIEFDLFGIPSSATILSCTLTLENYGAGRCNASVQRGTQTGNLFGWDYSAFTGFSFGVRSWSSGSNVFPLVGAGALYIQSVFGLTAKLCIREYDHDYLNVEPGDPEDFHAGLHWSGTLWPSNRPKLTVKYVE